MQSKVIKSDDHSFLTITLIMQAGGWFWLPHQVIAELKRAGSGNETMHTNMWWWLCYTISLSTPTQWIVEGLLSNPHQCSTVAKLSDSPAVWGSTFIIYAAASMFTPTLVQLLGSGQNWMEVAYGTRAGKVCVVFCHPEDIEQAPQIFQTYTVCIPVYMPLLRESCEKNTSYPVHDCSVL